MGASGVSREGSTDSPRIHTPHGVVTWVRSRLIAVMTAETKDVTGDQAFAKRVGSGRVAFGRVPGDPHVMVADGGPLQDEPRRCQGPVATHQSNGGWVSSRRMVSSGLQTISHCRLAAWRPF